MKRPEIGASVGLRWAECSAHHARGWISLGSDGASSRLFGTQSWFGQRRQNVRKWGGLEKMSNESDMYDWRDELIG